MLLMTITGTFNDVWRVRKNRSVVMQLMVFWGVLTLAPIFFGASLTLSSYLFTVVRSSGVEEYTGSLTRIAFTLPFFMQTVGLSILFLVVPNFPVRRRDAVMGGVVCRGATGSFEGGFWVLYCELPNL